MTLDEIMDNLAKRPSMYIGNAGVGEYKPRLELAESFLAGFLCSHPEFSKQWLDFREFVMSKLGRCSLTVCGTIAILGKYGFQSKGFYKLMELWDEFKRKTGLHVQFSDN